MQFEFGHSPSFLAVVVIRRAEEAREEVVALEERESAARNPGMVGRKLGEAERKTKDEMEILQEIAATPPKAVEKS